jgi:uncharacterized protein YerC
LTLEKVRELRLRLAEGSTYKDASREFGIAISLVGKIRRHENWA